MIEPINPNSEHIAEALRLVAKAMIASGILSRYASKSPESLQKEVDVFIAALSAGSK